MPFATTRIYWPAPYSSKPAGWIIGWNKKGLTVVVASISRTECTVLEPHQDSADSSSPLPAGAVVLGEWHSSVGGEIFSSKESRAFSLQKRRAADLWLVLHQPRPPDPSGPSERHPDCPSSPPTSLTTPASIPLLKELFCCGCRYSASLQLVLFDPSTYFRVRSPSFSLTATLQSASVPSAPLGWHDAQPSSPADRDVQAEPARDGIRPTDSDARSGARPDPGSSADSDPSSPVSTDSTRKVGSGSSSNKESVSDSDSRVSPTAFMQTDSDEEPAAHRAPDPATSSSVGPDAPRKRSPAPEPAVPAPPLGSAPPDPHGPGRRPPAPGTLGRPPLPGHPRAQHSRTSSTTTGSSGVAPGIKAASPRPERPKRTSDLAEIIDMLNAVHGLDHILAHHRGPSRHTPCHAPKAGRWLRASQTMFQAARGWLRAAHSISTLALPLLKLRVPSESGLRLSGVFFTGQQLDKRNQEFANAQRVLQLLTNEPSSPPTTTSSRCASHPRARQHISLAYADWLARQLADLALGTACAAFAWHYAPAIYAALRPPVQYLTQDMPEAYMDWILGWPAGFKANDQLNLVLGQSTLACLAAWRGLAVHLESWWPTLIAAVGLSGLCGFTTLVAILADLVVLGTVHLHLLYWVFAKVCSVQLCILDNLGMLFRGKKFNPLRNRVDSAEFSLEQLLLGTVWFTLLIFIFPTVAIYYLFFAAVELLLTATQEALHLVVEGANNFPVFLLSAYVCQHFQSHPIPDGVLFELIDDPEPAVPPRPPPPPPPPPPNPKAVEFKATHAYSQSYSMGTYRSPPKGLEPEPRAPDRRSPEHRLALRLKCRPMGLDVVFHNYLAAARDALRHCTPGRLWGGLVVPLATGNLARLSPFPDPALPRANAPVVTLPDPPPRPVSPPDVPRGPATAPTSAAAPPAADVPALHRRAPRAH